MVVLSKTDRQLVTLLQTGKVGVMPTDTVYGLVCLASNPSAVERLYDLKDRHHKPGTVIAATKDQLIELGIKARYLTAASAFWPGAISVVLPGDQDHAYLDMGKGTIAVRITADTGLQKLIEQTGPLLTTSANHPGRPPATTMQAARDYFGDKIDFYVDGPDLSDRQPSTIIRVVDDAVEIIREGAVKVHENGRIDS